MSGLSAPQPDAKAEEGAGAEVWLQSARELEWDSEPCRQLGALVPENREPVRNFLPDVPPSKLDSPLIPAQSASKKIGLSLRTRSEPSVGVCFFTQKRDLKDGRT